MMKWVRQLGWWHAIPNWMEILKKKSSKSPWFQSPPGIWAKKPVAFLSIASGDPRRHATIGALVVREGGIFEEGPTWWNPPVESTDPRNRTGQPVGSRTDRLVLCFSEPRNPFASHHGWEIHWKNSSFECKMKIELNESNSSGCSLGIFLITGE